MTLFGAIKYRGRKMKIKYIAMMVALVLGLNESVNAALFHYNDEVNLQESLTSYTKEDFNSFTSDTASFGFGGSRTVGGLTLSASAPLEQRNYIDAPPVQFGVFNVDGTTVVNALIPSRWYSFTISFSEDVTAFGANFANFSIDHEATVSVNNASADSLTVFNAGQAVEYIGFSSDTPFNSVTLTVPEATGFGIDNITYGAIPEPGVISLMAVFGGGIVFVRRFFVA
jgi:hypothetical protein